MLRFAADENFDGRIVRGLLGIFPELDLWYECRIAASRGPTTTPSWDGRQKKVESY
jgi:hypothetical protein